MGLGKQRLKREVHCPTPWHCQALLYFSLFPTDCSQTDLDAVGTACRESEVVPYGRLRVFAEDLFKALQQTYRDITSFGQGKLLSQADPRSPSAQCGLAQRTINSHGDISGVVSIFTR